MIKKNTEVVIPDEIVIRKIFFVRGKKVMLDKDLSGLYDVETKALNQAVKRNLVKVSRRLYVPVIRAGV